MKRGDVSYSGLSCYLCKYWFCKMYLLKQHNRKYHKDFGEILDLPTAPVKHLYPDNYMLFALLHAHFGPPLLMRMFETKTQSTMRLANNYDFEELNEQKETEDRPKFEIVYNVYPRVSDGKINEFTVIWRKPINQYQNSSMREKASSKFCSQPVPQRANLMDDTNIFLQTMPSPFCNLLEHMAVDFGLP